MANPKIKTIKVGDKTRYRFTVDIGLDPKTGKRKQKTHTHDRRNDAQADLAKIVHEVNRGRLYPIEQAHDRRTSGRLAALGDSRQGSGDDPNYEDALRPVKDRLGAVPLQKLTTVHVEDFVDWMLTSGRKRGKGRQRPVA